MATITQFPKSIQPAFNPILLKLTTTTFEESATIYVTINSKVYTLTKEFFDFVIVFDLSFLLRKHVSKTTPVVAYSINYASNTYNFFALNAVKQIGESTDMTSIKGKFLTLMPFVRYYEGFTTQIVFYQFTGQNKIQYGSNPATNLPLGITALVPTSSASRITIVAAGNSESIECINSCVPESPFYVRWINQLGGLDYWMFGKRQEKALSVSNLKEYNPFFEDSASVNTNRKLLSRESSRIVEVGAEMIKDNEFDELIKILLSPDIEYYNGSKWVPISITNQEATKTTSNAHHSIALEFELPNPILQTNN